MARDDNGLRRRVAPQAMTVRTLTTTPLTEDGSRARWALALSTGLVATTALWGAQLNGVALHAAPLFAAASSRVGPRVILPIAVASLVVWRGPAVADELSWRRLLVFAALASALWGIALALVDFGGEGLVRGVSGPVDLLADVARIPAPAAFLDTFVERIGDHVVHVRGHPPGLVVALWWLRDVGLGGAAPMAALAIVLGSAAVAAVLVVVRSVADESAARRAAPVLVLTPAAIWMVTSADAIYAGLGAIGIACVVVAMKQHGLRSDLTAGLGGLVFGAGAFTSYGLVLLLVIPAAIALAWRRLRPLVVSGVGMIVVGVAFAAFGFSWLDGLAATRAEYAASIASTRPYLYFVFANLAAFAVVLGPAPVAGLAMLRDRRVWLVVGAAAAAVVLADLSGLSKGEVERIWLPFWPWIAIASVGLASRLRWWLAAQAALAIGIQTLLGTPW